MISSNSQITHSARSIDYRSLYNLSNNRQIAYYSPSNYGRYGSYSNSDSFGSEDQVITDPSLSNYALSGDSYLSSSNGNYSDSWSPYGSQNPYDPRNIDFSNLAGNNSLGDLAGLESGPYPGDASDQALNDFLLIAQGKGTEVLNLRLYGFMNETFDDANMSPASGYLGESYSGVPVGNFLTDCSISKDISLKVQLMESRIQYVISYLLGLLEQGPDALAGLLQRRGMSREAAQQQATVLLNEIQRKAPDFVAAAQRAVRQAKQRIEGMQQIGQASDARTQTLNGELSKVISSFGGGGGGAG